MAEKKAEPEKEAKGGEVPSEGKRPTCGFIMPISAIDGCGPEHWADVLGILKDVCDKEGFESYIVSEAEDIGIIHNRIVDNIYSSDVVICDVSCKNANVMFELGMRLEFDKATIIIKDDKTGYSFDTSPIEHLDYPRDLRFNKIIEFKELLGRKLKATYNKSKQPEYSTFLKNFGTYKVAGLQNKEITSEKFMVEAMEAIGDLKRDIRIIKGQSTILDEQVTAKNFDRRKLTRDEYLRVKVRSAITAYLNENNLTKNDLNLEIISILTEKIRTETSEYLDLRSREIDELIFKILPSI